MRTLMLIFLYVVFACKTTEENPHQENNHHLDATSFTWQIEKDQQGNYYFVKTSSHCVSTGTPLHQQDKDIEIQEPIENICVKIDAPDKLTPGENAVADITIEGLKSENGYLAKVQTNGLILISDDTYLISAKNNKFQIVYKAADESKAKIKVTVYRYR